jgi:hypothetical protein
MAPVGRSDFKGFPPAIASTQFEAIENRSHVADGARWALGLQGIPARNCFDAIRSN